MFDACLLALDNIEIVQNVTDYDQRIKHSKQALRNVYDLKKDGVEMPQFISSMEDKHIVSESDKKELHELFKGVENATLCVIDIADIVVLIVCQVKFEKKKDAKDLYNSLRDIVKLVDPNSEALNDSVDWSQFPLSRVEKFLT